MTPTEARRMYAYQLNTHGEAMTLTRGLDTQAVIGRVIRASRTPQDQTDTVAQRDFAVVILAEGLDTLTPERGDRLTIGAETFAIETVDDHTRRVAGEIIAYEVTI
jgi:hypothetical protein